MKKEIIAVGLGEVLWDVFPDGKRLGGAPANFSYHLAQQGFRAELVSAVGADADGNGILKLLAQKHVSTKYTSRVPAPTGRVDVAVDSKGVAAYRFSENCAWDNLVFSPENEKLAKRADAVCFGTLAQRGPRSREAILRFLDAMPASSIRVFDVNLRQNFFSEEIILGSLERCSVLKINEDETPTVSKLLGVNLRSRETFFDAVFEKFPGIKMIAQTLGKAGSIVRSRNGTHSEIAAEKSIRLIDTVGAGDAFSAGFVSALLQGASVREAHFHAAKLAGYVCSQAGAMPDVSPAYRFSKA